MKRRVSKNHVGEAEFALLKAMTTYTQNNMTEREDGLFSLSELKKSAKDFKSQRTNLPKYLKSLMLKDLIYRRSITYKDKRNKLRKKQYHGLRRDDTTFKKLYLFFMGKDLYEFIGSDYWKDNVDCIEYFFEKFTFDILGWDYESANFNIEDEEAQKKHESLIKIDSKTGSRYHPIGSVIDKKTDQVIKHIFEPYSYSPSFPEYLYFSRFFIQFIKHPKKLKKDLEGVKSHLSRFENLFAELQLRQMIMMDLCLEIDKLPKKTADRLNEDFKFLLDEIHRISNEEQIKNKKEAK